MQKQSYILKRRGFALITAIFLLVIISAMLTTMLSISSTTGQRTVNDYLNEQAVLLAYGATEQAILVISAVDPSVGCITTTGPDNYPTINPILTVETTIQYIWADGQTAPSGVDLNATSCKNYIHDGVGTANVPVGQLSTAESGGAVLIDVYVQSAATLGLNERIKYHRRTLQKL